MQAKLRDQNVQPKLSVFTLILVIYQLLSFVQSTTSFEIGRYTLFFLFAIYVLTIFLGILFSQKSSILRSISFGYNGLTILLLMSTLILISSLINRNTSISVLIASVFFLLVYISSRYSNFNDHDYETTISIITVYFIIVCSLYVLFNFVIFKYATAESINSYYYILMGFPFVLLNKKPLIRRVSMLLLVVLAVFSGKRTAIIALVFAITVMSLLNRKSVKLETVITFIVVVPILIFFLSLVFSTNILVVQKFLSISLDGGSGRLEIYTSLINTIKTLPFSRLLVGYGYEGVTLYSGINTSAHNDFLEILFNFGIFGFVIYILFYIYLSKMSLQYVRYERQYKAYIFSISVFFIVSLFSNIMFIPSYFLLLTLFWGTLHGYHFRRIKYENNMAM